MTSVSELLRQRKAREFFDDANRLDCIATSRSFFYKNPYSHDGELGSFYYGSPFDIRYFMYSLSSSGFLDEKKKKNLVFLILGLRKIGIEIPYIVGEQIISFMEDFHVAAECYYAKWSMPLATINQNMERILSKWFMCTEVKSVLYSERIIKGDLINDLDLYRFRGIFKTLDINFIINEEDHYKVTVIVSSRNVNHVVAVLKFNIETIIHEITYLIQDLETINMDFLN